VTESGTVAGAPLNDASVENDTTDGDPLVLTEVTSELETSQPIIALSLASGIC